MSSTEAPVSTLRTSWNASHALLWARRNLFNGWLNTLITLVLLWAIPAVLFQILRWVIGEATWAPVWVNLQLFMTGRYPQDQAWRVQLCVAIILLLFGLSAGIWGGLARTVGAGLAAAAAVLALLPFTAGTRLWLLGLALLLGLGFAAGRWRPRLLRRPTIGLWLVSPFICLLLVRGLSGSSALPAVPTNLWGGLLLTVILAVFPIVISFPLGVLLALGRRSSLPVVKGFCVVYIEVVRGVPLITVLFISLVMLPLFLPAGARPDLLIRAIVALTLFSAAYLAENVRGGLQAVPNGQIEAAKALGLNVFQSTLLIVLPQALRAVIPAIVGQFISLFKDTSLVAIIGLTELLGIANVVFNQPDWLTVRGGVQRESLLFVGLVYWIFCFTMAQASRRIETRLGVGTR